MIWLTDEMEGPPVWVGVEEVVVAIDVVVIDDDEVTALEEGVVGTLVVSVVVKVGPVVVDAPLGVKTKTPMRSPA
jgi:predicted nuclease with RNAse H fold